MATKGLADFTVTTAWQDVIATLTAAASVDVCVQNVCPNPNVRIQVAGATAAATAPAGTGLLLGQYDSVTTNSGSLWVRSEAGGAGNVKLAVSLV